MSRQSAHPRLQPKHQRLILALLALAALIGASLLAIWALQKQAAYFYLADELLANPPAIGQSVRLGGMVEDGSIVRLPDGITITFNVTDMASARVPVRFSGIAPDLFVEGSGVVAEGSLDAEGTFIADNLLAKHDENYVPRELEEMSAHQAAAMAEGETLVAP